MGTFFFKLYSALELLQGLVMIGNVIGFISNSRVDVRNTGKSFKVVALIFYLY